MLRDTPRKRAFWRRYRAFILPWLVILAVPSLRQVARHQFTEPHDQRGQPAAAAQGNGDFDGQVDQAWSPVDDDGDNNSSGVQGRADLDALVKRSPEAKWLACLRLRIVLLYPVQFTSQQKNAASELPAKAIFLERDNAFPVLCAAKWKYDRLFQDRAALQAKKRPISQVARRAQDESVLWLLHLAASKKIYEEHMLDLLGCRLRAREARRPVTLEEKINLARDCWAFPVDESGELKSWAMQQARLSRVQGQHRRAIQIAADLAHLGNLIQHSRNTGDDDEGGDLFLLAFGSLLPATKIRGRTQTNDQGRTASRVRFLSYAREHGMAAVAQAMAREWKASDRLKKWHQKDRRSINTLVADDGVPLSVGMTRDTGLALLAQGILVLPFWIITAGLFRRVVPRESSRRERGAVALTCASVSTLLTLCCWLVFLRYSTPTPSPAPPQFLCYFVGAAALAFVAPVLLSWFLCTLLSWRRTRDLFDFRADSRESMKLSAFQAIVMQNFLAILVWGLVIQTLACCAFCILACRFASTRVDLPDFLTQFDSSLNYMSWLDLAAATLVASLLELAPVILIWILKWRWWTAPRARPATHAALRWWKESMGAYLILLSWLYLGIALLNIPVRARASREFDRIVRLGEIGALYENRP